MAKILTEPKSGKIGLNVFQGGRFGQIVRTLAIPTNPRSAAQRAVRERLKAAVRAWAGLTQTVRDAWTASAANIQSNSRLGLSGKLTGNQFFTKVYCNSLIIGGDAPETPPAIPTFTDPPVTALEITWVSHVLSIRLATSGSPPDGTMLRGAAPCSAGRYRSGTMVYLGTLGSPSGDKIDIKTQYVGRFGAPAAGQKVFVEVQQNQYGILDQPVLFTAIVPADS